MTSAKVLDKDAFDAIEMSALIYRGIGAGHLVEEQITVPSGASWARTSQTPYCLFGHAGFLSAISDTDFWNNPVAEALEKALSPNSKFGLIRINNDAVRRINARKRRANLEARVSWPEYTRELNIVRGE